MDYKIEIAEILQRVLVVSAEDANQAIKKAQWSYDTGEVIIDAEDYTST